jgi:hypothetical protein
MTSEKYSELESEVTNTLQKLKELTEAQLAAFRARDQAEFIRLDKELEKTMGGKERAIGAFRQHTKEHNCQARSPEEPSRPSPLKNQERASTG